MDNPYQQIETLFTRAKVHFAQALAQYRLVPPGSISGYPERNMTNAVAMALGGLQEQGSEHGDFTSWSMLVEVPFCDLRKHQRKDPNLSPTEARLNARLDALIISPEACYLIECKQFYQVWKVNDQQYGLAADLARLQDPGALSSLFGASRLRAAPPKRLVVIGLMDCWRNSHVQFLSNGGEHRGWETCSLSQSGFRMGKPIPFDFVTPTNPDFKGCDGYWWVWGAKEIRTQ